jgi:hypothetical protein
VCVFFLGVIEKAIGDIFQKMFVNGVDIFEKICYTTCRS